MIDFDLAQVVSLLIGVVLPIITGLVTKWETSPGTRAVVLLALSAVTGFATEFLATLNSGTAFDLGATLLATFGTFLTGVGLHFGLWKPVGVSATVKRIGSRKAPPAPRDLAA
jgi:hypothetical protein